MPQGTLTIINGKLRHPDVMGKAIHFLGTCSAYRTDQLFRAFRRIGASYSVSGDKAQIMVIGDGAMFKKDEAGVKHFYPGYINQIQRQYPQAMVVHESEVPTFFTDETGKSHYVSLAIDRPRDDF